VRNFGASLEMEVEGEPDEINKSLLEIELKLSSAIGSIKQAILQVPPVCSTWFEIPRNITNVHFPREPQLHMEVSTVPLFVT